jgi:hypothetical protein
VQEMPELSAWPPEKKARSCKLSALVLIRQQISHLATNSKSAIPVVAGMSGTELSRQFGNSGGGLPFTVLIGADGQVKKTYLGRLKFDELRKDLASL